MYKKKEESAQIVLEMEKREKTREKYRGKETNERKKSSTKNTKKRRKGIQKLQI